MIWPKRNIILLKRIGHFKNAYPAFRCYQYVLYTCWQTYDSFLFFFYLNKKRRLIILRFDLVGMVPHLLNHPACHTDVLFKEQEVYLPVSCCIWYCKGRLTQRTYTFITYGIRVSVTPHLLGLPFRKGGDHPWGWSRTPPRLALRQS